MRRFDGDPRAGWVRWSGSVVDTSRGTLSPPPTAVRERSIGGLTCAPTRRTLPAVPPGRRAPIDGACLGAYTDRLPCRPARRRLRSV